MGKVSAQGIDRAVRAAMTSKRYRVTEGAATTETNDPHEAKLCWQAARRRQPDSGLLVVYLDKRTGRRCPQ